MGLLGNTKTNSNSNKEGMGLLLVFFPEHNRNTNIISSSSSSFKTTNSNALLSKAQSTISICAFLFLTTFLLFTLSTFEPTSTIHTNRFFLHKPHHFPPPKPKPIITNHWFFWPHKPQHSSKIHSHFKQTALQRMGTLYRRGTKAMNDIVVCHVIEDTTEEEFRSFLRILHRSGITSKSDVVFIFNSLSMMSHFDLIIREENDSFFSLIEIHRELNSTNWLKHPVSGFDVTRFFKVKKKVEAKEPLWGKKIRSNSSGSEAGDLNSVSYGSVLSFDANELDPENSLAGFLDRVPLCLRRWACYPMLLGRVRRNFKHVMLLDVKSLVIFNDPLGRVRNRSPESVFLYPVTGKHGKRNSEKTRSQNLVNSAVIMGGARGVRRLSNAMLIEIVRVAMQHKKKNSVSESAILSHLVRNEFVLKNVDLVTSSESIPETSQLGAMNSAGSTSFSDHQMIQRGMGNYDLNFVIKKQICSSLVDSSVYRDC